MKKIAYRSVFFSEVLCILCLFTWPVAAQDSLNLTDLYLDKPSYRSAMMGHFATGIALADINGDERPDLIISNGNDMSPQHLVVFYNYDKDDPFNMRPDWYSETTDYHCGLAVGDIDRDGWLDVAVAVPFGKDLKLTGGGIKIYRNKRGELEPTPSLTIRAGYGPLGCALGDIDGDARLDLVVAVYLEAIYTEPPSLGRAFDAAYPRIYLNRRGRYSKRDGQWRSGVPLASGDALVADINQDGWMDVAFAASSTTIFYGIPDPESAVPLSTTPDWTSSDTHLFSYSLDAGQLSGNETLALAASSGCLTDSECESRFVLYLPKAGEDPIWYVPAVGASKVLLADLNEDGLLDLLADQWGPDTKTGGPLWFFQGSAEGFGPEPSIRGSDQALVVGQGIAVGDLRRKGVRKLEHTFNVVDSRKVLTLPDRRLEAILEVRVDGDVLSSHDYVWVPNQNWISFKSALEPGNEVVVRYRASTVQDIVMATWDPDEGYMIYYRFPAPHS